MKIIDLLIEIIVIASGTAHSQASKPYNLQVTSSDGKQL